MVPDAADHRHSAGAVHKGSLSRCSPAVHWVRCWWQFHPWVAFDTLFNTMIDSVDFSILMFMILLGMVVMLMQESGGTRAYGEWAAKSSRASAPRSWRPRCWVR